MLAKFDFVPQLFAVLFFLMLITLGLGSAVGFISAVTTTIYDSFPGVDQKFILKICCVVGSVAIDNIFIRIYYSYFVYLQFLLLSDPYVLNVQKLQQIKRLDRH